MNIVTLSPSELISFAANSEQQINLAKSEEFYRTLNHPISELDEWVARNSEDKISSYFNPNIGGKADHEITHITCLMIDVDAKDKQWNDIRLPDGSIELPTFHLTPSLVNRTGSGGFQAFWIFPKPIAISDLDYLKSQSKLIQHYQADPSIKNPSRLMRVPGSINVKNQSDPKECYCTIHNPELRYTPDQIMDGLAELKEVKPDPKPIVRATSFIPAETDNSRIIKVGEKKYLLTTDQDAGTDDDVLQHYLNWKYEQLLNTSEYRNNKLHEVSNHISQLDIDQYRLAEIQGKLYEVALEIGLEPGEIQTTIHSAFTSNNSAVGYKLVPLKEGTIKVDLKWAINYLRSTGIADDVWFNIMDQYLYIGTRKIDELNLQRLAVQAFDKYQSCPYIHKELTEDGANFTAKSLSYQPKDVLLEALFNIGLKNEINPAVNYLCSLNHTEQEEIQAWKDLQEFYGLSELTIEALKYGFNQAVRAMFNPTASVKTMVILFGAQDTGKTSFLLQALQMGDVKPVIADFPDVNKNKDSFLNILGRSAVIVDELATPLRARNIDSTKALITTREVVARSPYARTSQEFTRYPIYWGATNERDILTDKTGNSRFLIVEWSTRNFAADTSITENEIALFIESIRGKLWGSAMRWKESGADLKLPTDLREQLTNSLNHAQYEQEDMVLDAASVLAIKGLNSKGMCVIPIAHIRELLKTQGYTGTDYSIKSILQRQGFTFTPTVTKIQSKSYRNCLVAELGKLSLLTDYLENRDVKEVQKQIERVGVRSFMELN